MSASSNKKLRREQTGEGLTERQRAELKEAKKVKIYTIVFTAVIAVVLISALGILIGRGVSNAGLVQKNTVALTVGEHKLNVVELNYFYMDAINNDYSTWRSNYGDYTAAYLQMMGLDLTKPLSAQVRDTETGETWADGYVNSAIENATSVYALCDAANAEGFTMPEESQADVDTSIDQMELAAKSSGFSSLDAYLRAVYGAGSSEKSFRTYCEMAELAGAYQEAHRDSLTYDDEAIRAYDSEHAGEYNSYTFASYYLSASRFYEGGTTDENGTTTYSDEEKAAGLARAKEAAESLLSAKNADTLDIAIAALEINKDSESAASTRSTDTLYSQVSESLRDWLADSARKEGDIAVLPSESTSKDSDGNDVTTTVGYYVVLFESASDNVTPLVNVRHVLLEFEGGTTAENGSTVYSDEEKAATKEAAEQLLADWKAGDATEESFAALATEHSTDPGSKENGGLYEDVYPGQMVTAFNDWCFEEGRKPGDTGIVESGYGYHIIYYVGQADTTYRDYMITNQLRTDDMNAWFDGIVDSASVTNGNTSHLNRDIVLSSGT